MLKWVVFRFDYFNLKFNLIFLIKNKKIILFSKFEFKIFEEYFLFLLISIMFVF